MNVILIVIDGLGYGTAIRELGYIEGLVEAGQAARWQMRCCLPSLSRPLYETIHSGQAPAAHGITANDVARPTTSPTLFSVAHAHGRSTAAAAYSWMHELFVSAPYDPLTDGEYDNRDAAINHGRFYQRDDFPDRELIWQAARLIRRHAPNFLLLHPMGCDNAGHRYGGESLEYRRTAAHIDDDLARVMPSWLAEGYSIVVTSDHGMCPDGHHGGTLPVVRDVPFYVINGGPSGVKDGVADQRSVAPTVLSLMGLPIPATMTAPGLL